VQTDLAGRPVGIALQANSGHVLDPLQLETPSDNGRIACRGSVRFSRAHSATCSSWVKTTTCRLAATCSSRLRMFRVRAESACTVTSSSSRGHVSCPFVRRSVSATRSNRYTCSKPPLHQQGAASRTSPHKPGNPRTAEPQDPAKHPPQQHNSGEPHPQTLSSPISNGCLASGISRTPLKWSARSTGTRNPSRSSERTLLSFLGQLPMNASGFVQSTARRGNPLKHSLSASSSPRTNTASSASRAAPGIQYP